ncbi:MAG: biopolymer transporter ExbD [Limnothrix sp. RL_2_0]|nr:biopolymer transporter ExbD [Limnothrix sp. RL_2_0]
MQLPDEGDRPLSINLVPMIDVIFSILAFFILSTLFLVPSAGLDINLPEAITATSQTDKALTIGVDKEGVIRFQEQTITLENLAAAIQAEMGENQKLVVIRADEAVNHGRVVEVMDQLRQISGIKLAIATIPPD